MKAMRLGARLVSRGVISGEQLEQALLYQRTQRGQGVRLRLGEALVRLGLCSDEQVAQARSEDSGYRLVSLNREPVDRAAAALLSPEAALRYRALPVGFEGERLRVAMRDPNDLVALDDLRLLTGRDILPVVVSDAELRAVLEQAGGFLPPDAPPPDEEPPGPADLSDGGADNPAVQLANRIIGGAARAGASDVHLEPQERSLRVRYRIDGVLHEMMQQPLSLHPPVVSRIKVLANMDIAERRVPQDGRTTVRIGEQVVDIRVSALPSVCGESVTLRLLDRGARMIEMEELGFPPADRERFLHALMQPHGFILVTGPTGSGKSTTLYAALLQLSTPDKNVITLEDPVERRIDGICQIQMNNRAGMTFSGALRSVLRSDPDVIMVGEIRDRETAKIAIDAAMTGHMVLSTLHTNDAAGAVARLGEMGVDGFLTASALAGVVAQRLVRVLCPRCRTAVQLPENELRRLAPDFPLPTDGQATLYRPVGCVACNRTGFRGRMGVYEFLSVTPGIRRLVVAGASDRDIHAAAVAEGMTTMRQDGYGKVLSGVTSLEELLRVIV